MQRFAWIPAWLVTLLAFLCLMAAQPKPPARPFVPGEIILKFSPKSKAADLVAHASAQGNLADPQVASYVDSLSREVRIPLEVKQFGSGGSLTVAIRRADLVADLLKRLRANTHVKEARVAPKQDAAALAVEADFVPGSPEAETLGKVAVGGRDSGPEVHRIAETLQGESGLCWTGRITSSRQLLLTLDLSALTLDLASRLGKRADVEYSQPNFIRRPMGVTGEVHPPSA